MGNSNYSASSVFYSLMFKFKAHHSLSIKVFPSICVKKSYNLLPASGRKPGIKGSSYLFMVFRGHLTKKQFSLKAKNNKNYGTHPKGKAIHNNKNNLQELNNYLTPKPGGTARF